MIVITVQGIAHFSESSVHGLNHYVTVSYLQKNVPRIVKSPISPATIIRFNFEGLLFKMRGDGERSACFGHG